jgi:uncharacterized membrane protein
MPEEGSNVFMWVLLGLIVVVIIVIVVIYMQKSQAASMPK